MTDGPACFICANAVEKKDRVYFFHPKLCRILPSHKDCLDWANNFVRAKEEIASKVMGGPA